MNPKVVKINAELDKNSAKIARLQARNKVLERQRTELENTDIIGLVREMGLTPNQLAALIHGVPPDAPPVPETPENGAEEPEDGGYAGYAGETGYPDQQEETAYEEE